MAERRPAVRDGLMFVHCGDCIAEGSPDEAAPLRGVLEVGTDVDGRLHVMCAHHDIVLLVVVIDDVEWPPPAPVTRGGRSGAQRVAPGRRRREPTADRL